MYFPQRGCVRTLRTLYVYTTAHNSQMFNSCQSKLYYYVMFSSAVKVIS